MQKHREIAQDWCGRSWVSLGQEGHGWGTKLEKEFGGTDNEYKYNIKLFLKYKAKEIGLNQVDDSENHPLSFEAGSVHNQIYTLEQ